jgi:hypothetical protein
MKKSILKISLILGTLTFILPGCLDIWFTTQVRPDGSIGQTIVFQGDSTEIATVPFALMKEGDWKREWTVPEKDKYKLVVSKDFSNVAEFNKTMNPSDTNLLVVRINSTLHRKFRWFFTRFVYEETILEANPFTGLDYHKYLTPEEVRQISLKDEVRKAEPGFDSIQYKVTEKKFEDFLYRSMYEDFHQELLSILKEDKSLTLSSQELNDKKDDIYRFLIDSLTGDSSDEILRGINKMVNHPDILTIRLKYLSRFDRFQEKQKFYESASDDSYKFAIRMPGLLLQTNSPKIEGSETAWEFTYYDFFFSDCKMTAESRIVNSWAFIVAGIVLLAALAGLIAGLLKRR